MTHSPQAGAREAKHPGRVLGWSVGLIAAALLVAIAQFEVHRPSPVHARLSAAEIGAEDALLKRYGLVVSDGSFLKSRPFEPPWTSHSLLVPAAWFNETPAIQRLFSSSRVRADLLLSDLDVLEPVMQRAYGGWDSAAARGWQWDQWFSDWRKLLAARGATDLSLEEAFAPIDALLAFQRDNHTQIPLQRRTEDPSQTAVLASPPSAPCVEIRAGGHIVSIAAHDAGQGVRASKLWRSGGQSFSDAHYISMPRSYGVPEALRCGDQWIPLQPAGRALAPGKMLADARLDRPRVERLGDGIVYTRLPTFEDANYENLTRESWAQRRPGDRVMIVDLRDNYGGDSTWGLLVLKGWLDERRFVPGERLGREMNASCLYPALSWRRVGYRERQKLLDRIAQQFPPDCPRKVNTTVPQWTYLQRRFDPRPGDLRIVALINSGCGSDCEGLTLQLASLPETVVVGTNTFGVAQFILPGYSVLPHTGLHYRISLGTTNYYGDLRSLDGYGLDVDVVLPEVDTLSPQQLRELAEVVAKL